MRIIFTLIMSFLGFCSPSMAQIDEVHNVQLRGTNYQIVELIHVKRVKINKLNALRFRRGARYHEYRILGADYHLKLYDDDYKRVAPLLKTVPDNRQFNERHPYFVPTFNVLNGAMTVVSWFV